MPELTYAEKIAEIGNEAVWDALDPEHKVKDPTIWTSSKLSTLGNCLWAYHLAFEEGALAEHRSANACRGTMLHRTISRLHTEKKWGDWADIYQEEMKATLESEVEAGIPWKTEKDDEFFADDGLSIVQNYVVKNRGARVIASEVPFRMILKHPRTGTAYRMAGTMDQLREIGEPRHNVNGDERALAIFDLKSDQVPPDAAYLARSKQFSTYGLALHDGVLFIDGEPVRFGQYPDELKWYQLHHLLPYKRKGTRSDGTKYESGDLRGDPEIEVSRTAQDYDFERGDICRAIQSVRMGLVWRSGAGNGTVCAMCRYRQACTTGIYAKRVSDATELTTLGDAG